jgi:hypothetical protein
MSRENEFLYDLAIDWEVFDTRDGTGTAERATTTIKDVVFPNPIVEGQGIEVPAPGKRKPLYIGRVQYVTNLPATRDDPGRSTVNITNGFRYEQKEWKWLQAYIAFENDKR